MLVPFGYYFSVSFFLLFHLLWIVASVRLKNVNVEPLSSLTRSKRASTERSLRRSMYSWPDGIIPYKIDKSKFDDRTIDMINEALDAWEEHTCLFFRPVDYEDDDFLVFSNGFGCSAQLGREGGRQVVSLGNGCLYPKTILHEMGHAIGLIHEHERPDRSQELLINRPERLPTYNVSDIETYGLPYDVQSVMQYPIHDMKDGGVSTKDPRKRKYIDETFDISMYRGLSFTDVAAANMLYKCSRGCPKRRCPAQGFIDHECRCRTPWEYARETCYNRRNNRFCARLQRRGDCEFRPFRASFWCKKSCKICYDYFPEEWRAVKVGPIHKLEWKALPCVNTYGNSRCNQLLRSYPRRCRTRTADMFYGCRRSCNREGELWCRRACRNLLTDSMCRKMYKKGLCNDKRLSRRRIMQHECFRTCFC